MKTRNIAAALVALMGLSSLAVQSASANDLSKILGSLTGYRSGGYINSGNQGQIRANIDTGISNLQNQISLGISSGKLDSVEQADLQARLNRVQDLDNRFSMDGVYTPGEVSQILSEFTNMNNMLTTALNTGASFNGNLGYGYNNGYSRFGTGIGYGNLANMRARISTNISTALSRGEISNFQARQMRSELNNISYQLNSNLSVSNRRLLMNRLASLNSRLDAAIAGRSRYY
jgi:hypothetical protein